MKTTWGGNTEEVVVTNNIQQAESTRDALAKGIYSRIFDFLVEVCRLYQNIRSAKFIYPEHQSFLASNIKQPEMAKGIHSVEYLIFG